MNRHTDPKIKLALDHGTDPLALASLAAQPKAHPLLLCAIAKNPHTPSHTLDKLAYYPNVAVRRWVAMNPNLSHEAFVHLSNDPDDSLQHKLRLGAHNFFVNA